MRRLFGVVLCLFLTALAAPSGYHVLKEIKIGGEGGSGLSHRGFGESPVILIACQHVAVIDIDAAKVVGDIPDTPGVHGIAIAPELNRGFTSNGRAGSVTIFDLKTLKPIGQT